MSLAGVQTQLSINSINELYITFENGPAMSGFVEALRSKGDIYRFSADYAFAYLRNKPCYTLDETLKMIRFTGYRTNNATRSPALAFPSVEAKKAFLELMGKEFEKMCFVANPLMDSKTAAVYLDKDFNGATIHIPEPQLKKPTSTNPAGTKKTPSEFRKKYVNNDNLMSIFFIIDDAKALAQNLRFDSFDAYMKSQNKILDKIDECFAYIPFRNIDLYNKINQQRDYFNQSKALKMELGEKLKGEKDPAKRREIESEFLSLRSDEIKKGMTKVLVGIEQSLGSFNQQFTAEHKDTLDLVGELQQMYTMIKQSFDPNSDYSGWIKEWVKQNPEHAHELSAFSEKMHQAVISLEPAAKAKLVDAIYNMDSVPLNLANRFLDKSYTQVKKLYQENLTLLKTMNEAFDKNANKKTLGTEQVKAPEKKNAPVLNSPQFKEPTEYKVTISSDVENDSNGAECYRTTVQFNDSESLQAFKLQLEAKAKELGFNITDVLKISSKDHKMLFIEASKGKGLLGTYKSLNDELSINLGHYELREFFCKKLNLNLNEALASKPNKGQVGDNALYFSTSTVALKAKMKNQKF